MTKDFKIADTASASSGQYGISWVLGGIAVGLLAGAAVYAFANRDKLDMPELGNTQATHTINTQLAVQPASDPNTNASLQDKPLGEDTRPGFSYHAVLPQLELDVPFQAQEDNAAPDTPAPLPAAEEQKVETEQAAAPAPAVTAGGNYMFQLGAYKSEAQAKQMQAQAKRNGLNTRVEAADVKGERWYRVRLGPTNDVNVVNKWKQMLSGMGISPMIIRL